MGKRKFNSKKEQEYYNSIWSHKRRVKKIIDILANILKVRGKTHDDSKLDEPQFSIIAKEFENLQSLTFGTPEYEENKKKIKPALDAHYSKNRHHIEFYPDGIKGMTLIDLIEFLVDIYCAAEKHDDGNVRFGIEYQREKYGFSKELEIILKNTIDFIDTMNEINKENKENKDEK